MDQKKSEQISYKIMLLGDSAVGKTSILLRFSDCTFSETFISTIGIDFRVKSIEIDSSVIKLQCWDTAGQERFHSLNISYYRNVDGFIVVYDITDEDSFNNIENWLNQISESSTKEYCKILIGNKSDLSHKRVVSAYKGEQLAKKHNMSFIETSALSNFNVDDAFFTLAKSIMKLKSAESNNIQKNVSNSNKEFLKLNLNNSYLPKNTYNCC